MEPTPIYDATVAALAKQARRSLNPTRWTPFEVAILAAIVAVGAALWLPAGMR